VIRCFADTRAVRAAPTWAAGLRGRLAVSDPADPAEREAERMTDVVMAMPSTGTVHRKAVDNAACPSAPAAGSEQDDEDVVPVMASLDGGGSPTTAPAPAGVSQATGGTPLTPTARSFFEPRFGLSFAAVRIHSDDAAEQAAGSLGAAAFTVGSDIYFATGRYAPETDAGRRLLAHELTHVAQHRVGPAATIARYTLNGFPPAEKAAMDAAIPIAIAKVAGCSGISWWGRRMTRLAIADRRYDYVSQLRLCGWTFPGSWYIEIGPPAFSPASCCDLASTIAHEASHTQLYTEGRARRLECECFGCSC
jgi:hypothetical protein